MSTRYFILTIGLLLSYFLGESAPNDSLDQLNKKVYHSIFQNPYTAEDLATNVLQQARAANNSKAEAAALVNMALLYYFQGRYERAFTVAIQAGEIADSINYLNGLGDLNLVKGLVSYANDNLDMAFTYTRKGLHYIQQTGATERLCHAYNNLGVFHSSEQAGDSARYYYQKAIDANPASPYPWINRGKWHNAQKRYQQAFNSLNRALKLSEKQNNTGAAAGSYLSLGEAYYALGRYPEALQCFNKAASYADEGGLLDIYGRSNKYLYNYYQNRNAYKEALNYYQNYVQSQEALHKIETKQMINDQIYMHENKKKEEELKLLRERSQLYTILSYMGGGGVLAILIFSLILWERYRKIKLLSGKIRHERNQFEHLLLNILPKETAEELKVYGKAKAKRHDSVSILFADVKNFTNLSEAISPEDLVYELDKLYSAFDNILKGYQVEKIKTIGDAYLAVSGLPQETADHAKQIIEVAFEMQNYVSERKTMHRNKHLPYFKIRVGIHSGSVVAGVVGKNKFAYDIWGNAVNIAARMEQNSEPGKINISEDTYHLINSYFDCTPRGSMAVKNKGKMNMYFVNCPKNVILKE